MEDFNVDYVENVKALKGKLFGENSKERRRYKEDQSFFFQQKNPEQKFQGFLGATMNNTQYAYPYPAQGNYQGPPVMAPPQYYGAPSRRQPSFLEGCLAALCCCCLIDECCCDPSIIIAF